MSNKTKTTGKARQDATSGLSAIRRADPHFEREKEKYELPLPSREYILKTLTDEGRPLPFVELTALLDILPHEVDLFRRRLSAMERDAELMLNRKGAYILPEKASLIVGRVQGHPDGYGFLVPDGGGDDVFLGSKQMDKVLHGDRALVRIVGLDRRGRPEGAIVEVTERGKRQVVGRVLIEHGVTCVVAEDRRISQDILIPNLAGEGKGEGKGKAKAALKVRSGQVVVVDITEPPTRHTQPIGRIVEILGDYADPGMEIEIALRKHDLPFEFSKAAEDEAAEISEKVRKSDLEGREDLRHLPLVTIDGETAKDFDDAVYCEKKGRGWRLIVAIADVSHYVRPGMALDKESMARGNSVYFPRRVIPMLPEKLSNGICSLNPDVDRLAMVCDMDINATGVIKDFRFYPAVFRSHARLTYNQVWSWLSGQEPDVIKTGAMAGLWKRLTGKGAVTGDERKPVLLPHLQNLYALFQALLKSRQKRGAIDFETTETMMLFDDQGKIANIIPVVRNDAHRLIEECMLAANVCASEFLHKHEQPCLYRIHEGPTEEKLERLREFLREFGLGLAGGDEPKAKDYATLLESIKTRPDAQLLQTVMLRSLRQAMYSPDNVGHFGLAYEAYTHFTSPIRRYPDLLVHRSIKAVLAHQRYQPGGKDGGSWTEIGLHCSATERRADEATRDVENWLKCYYMQGRIGEEFDGTVASVVPFGIFVALDSVYVEGLVHVSELGEDYFNFDAAKHQMLGERSGKRYRLGDRLRVRIVRADLETGKIDFTIVAVSGQKGADSTSASTGKSKAPAVEPMYFETVAARTAPKSERKPGASRSNADRAAGSAGKGSGRTRGAGGPGGRKGR